MSDQGKRTEPFHGDLKSYVSGFVLSIILTVEAYAFVVQHTQSRSSILAAILGLAVAQFAVQLIFFLHLGREGKPRWNLMVLMLALMVIGVVVFGSLWIMSNLDYHHHNIPTTSQVNKYLKNQDGL